MTWYDAKASGKSTFCQGIGEQRRYRAMWVPWVKSPGDMAKKVNTRCSMGSAFLPVKLVLIEMDRIEVEGFIRPVVRLTLGNPAPYPIAAITVLVVHMISGYVSSAKRQIQGLLRSMSQLIPEKSVGIVVGDMNVNLLTLATPIKMPAGWAMLNTGVATQQSGGELDYGFLWDPEDLFKNPSVSVQEQYKTGTNPSDHSVLRYDLV